MNELVTVKVFEFCGMPGVVRCHPDSAKLIETLNRVMVEGFERQKKLRKEIEDIKNLIRERRDIGRRLKELCEGEEL